ncbi:nucleotide exchange factor GrpE [Candidatus Dojkabacteria bacterium]|nr:nucleotide exchange factor GrpE [Candidatus Dojkabacteria bacterium]
MKTNKEVKKQTPANKPTEVEILKSQLAKALADYDNLKKRAAKDTEQLIFNRIKEISTELLLIMDSLELAKQENRKKTDEWVNGVLSIFEMLPGFIEKLGLTEISVKEGDTFDPSLHEALSTLKTKKFKKNTVAAVVSKGYMLEGNIVRPTRVIVASQ